MGDAGILRPDARVELVDGEIIDMAPIGSRHAGAVERIAAMLRRIVGDTLMVRTQQPVSLDEHSEPQPDIAVVRARADFYATGHPRPADILVIVEVSDSSLRHDEDVKAPLYARHGVRELWVFDLEHHQVTRRTDPQAGAYARRDVAGPELTMVSTALGGALLDFCGVL